ncbi:MAG: hypothetical protein ACRCY9_00765 [Phycicoccus sp.]
MAYRKFLSTRFGVILILIGAFFLLVERGYLIQALLAIVAGTALLYLASRMPG